MTPNSGIWHRNEALSSRLQKPVGRNIGLFENGSQPALRHVARMVRDRGVLLGGRVKPDFVAASSLAIELEAELFEFAGI